MGKKSAASTARKMERPEPRPRVVAWMKELEAAGEVEARARAVLNRIRDDKNATPADHEHFRRALAQQSFIWYVGAIQGRPLTPEELTQMAREEAAKRRNG